jgi:hypothetical protein
LDGQTQPLWSNHSSSYNGRNDRVSEQEVSSSNGSLRLIDIKDLEIQVGIEGLEFGDAKRRVRGMFSHLKVQYLLSITDPLIEARFLAGQDGQTRIGRALLCVSLGDLWQGYAYKLIAAVILPET